MSTTHYAATTSDGIKYDNQFEANTEDDGHRLTVVVADDETGDVESENAITVSSKEEVEVVRQALNKALDDLAATFN